jgi:hypothetical protein
MTHEPASLTEAQFFQQCQLVVTRMDLYPEIEHQGWVVGFTVTCRANQMSKYAYATLTLEEAGNGVSMDVARLAWDKLRPEMLAWGAIAQARSHMLGQVVEYR